MASPTSHAKLSASGASKWINNPPSLWMEEGLPDTTSPYAQEGTDAHRLVELKLKLALGKIKKTYYTRQVNQLKKKSEFYGKAMEEYADQHVDAVLEDFNTMPEAISYLEQKVDFSKWAPGGFGTSDTILVNDEVLSIWDLKYGKGVKVRADHNVQMMLYALGAIDFLGMLYEFTTVRMTIDQPRLGNLDTFEISTKELLDWGDKVVKPAADKALNGEGPWDFADPGTWTFYKAAGFDKHLAEENLKIRKYKFKEANTLTDDELADILKVAPRIEKWLVAVKDYATDQIMSHGKEVPGFKVVEGRSNRRITNQEKAAEVLTNAGFEDVFKPKELQTLTNLKKIVGKDLDDILADLIVKPTGKPTLVPDTDKRPALNSTAQAVADFSEEQL